MRAVILGTAGHIDHGKTALVEALTGTDTDRLKEEKERGITVDLGFAELDTEEGIHFGVVDVPGHEDFIKNMVAGATGMDVVLLVVAGSWQVQQRYRQDLEHYARPVATRTVTLAEWQAHYWRELPVYRVDIEGLDEQPMNIQWAGSLRYLEQLLAALGWQPAPAIGVSSIS